jgi:hypothetical protein
MVDDTPANNLTLTPLFGRGLSYAGLRHSPSARGARDAENAIGISPGRKTMGKYALGWFLGVPAIVLVVIYFLFN